MRNYQGTNISADYPEQVIWLQDSNVVNLSAVDVADTVGAEITIRHPGGALARTIRYISEMPQLLFVLDDALAALHDDNIGQYSCQVDTYINGQPDETFTFSFQLLDGKSFTNRSHAISRTMYIYDPSELVKVQIYSPGNGVLAVGGHNYPLYEGLNQYNLSSLIQGDGVYTMCLMSASQAPVAHITGDVPVNPETTNIYWSFQGGGASGSIDGGDVWGDVEVFPICHTLVIDSSCGGNDWVELRYKDCDGCDRYLMGKIVKETNKATSSPYVRTETTNYYRNIPRRKINGTTRSITVGFNDISTDAYPQDIRYSENVWMRMYNGEWWPVALNTESIAVKGDQSTQDIELEIIISEE